MTKKSLNRGLNIKKLVIPLIFVIGLYVILPQFKTFRSSLHYLYHPNFAYFILSALFMTGTFFAAALSYMLFAKKRLRYFEELFVQLSAIFVNQTLPAGIGGIGANYEYLKHKGHKSYQAATVVAMNNLSGLIGHIIIVVTALALFPPSKILPIHISSNTSHVVRILLAIVIFAVLVFLFIGYRKIKKTILNVAKQLITYEHNPKRTAVALLSQMTLTLCYVFCLFYSSKAVGIHLSFVITLIIFTFGNGLKNFSPTPGGLGGYEAALLAAFLAYNASTQQALAAVLLFRLISYWIPLVLGLFSFIYTEKLGWYSDESAA